MSKVFFVTGGGNGIGAVTAELFSDRGFRVVVVDSDELAAKRVAEKLDGFAIRCDISNPEDVARAVECAVDQFGRIDVAFLNAGIEGTRAELQDYPIEIFDRVVSTNLRGTFLCMQAVIRQMRSQGGGAIVVNSSVAGTKPFPEFSPYCASKFAIVGMARSAAQENASHKIRINIVCPATTRTPMLDRFASQWPEWQKATNSKYLVGRVCEATEVAEAVWFLADVEGKCSFMVGEVLQLSGGMA